MSPTEADGPRADGRDGVRVLVADDQRLFAEAVMTALDATDVLDVIGRARDGEEAVALAESLRPDLVLMDLVMPNLDGIEATRRIKASHPEITVLMLATSEAEGDVRRAIEAGAAGYLTKDTAVTELVETIVQLAVLTGRATD